MSDNDAVIAFVFGLLLAAAFFVIGASNPQRLIKVWAFIICVLFLGYAAYGLWELR